MLSVGWESMRVFAKRLMSHPIKYTPIWPYIKQILRQIMNYATSLEPSKSPKADPDFYEVCVDLTARLPA